MQYCPICTDIHPRENMVVVKRHPGEKGIVVITDQHAGIYCKKKLGSTIKYYDAQQKFCNRKATPLQENQINRLQFLWTGMDVSAMWDYTRYIDNK